VATLAGAAYIRALVRSFLHSRFR